MSLNVLTRSSLIGKLRIKEATQNFVRRVQDRLVQNTVIKRLFCKVGIIFSLFDVLLGKTVKKLKWSLKVEIYFYMFSS